MQLVAYGAQDVYLSSSYSFMRPDDCRYDYYSGIDERNYNNFTITTIRWYENGNKMFTENKYNELLEMYNKMDNLIINSNLELANINIEVVKGNTEINQELERQITSAKVLVKEDLNLKNKNKHR